MNRRELIALAVGAAAFPSAARAQRKPTPVIGYLSGGSANFYAPILSAFRDGLAESGYTEGKNVAIEYRWAEGHYNLLPAFAAEMVGRPVDLIVASGGDPASFAAQKATSTIPIVFTTGSDPVADGRVASFARPGGNLTGVSFLTSELHPKRFDLITQMVPQPRVVALLVNPNGSSTERVINAVSAAAAAKGVQLTVLKVTAERDFENAFGSLDQLQAGALIVQTEPFIDAKRDQLVALAAQYAVPAIYGFHQFAVAGGLMTYGISLPAVYRQVGVYAGKILAGAKPAELPVQQPTKFELAINLKTAKALGLTVPQLLLAQADEVIE